MAATKYQVLYRYINEATNTAITNSMDNAYDPVCEFYTDPDHKIFSNSPNVQAEAVNEQQEMISYGNSSANPKTNMLFAYDGTKKIKHQKWVEEATGYIVRDYTRIKRGLIGNQGDFTKEFTTLNAATPEDGGLVVCKKSVFDKYFPSEVTVLADANQGDLSNDYGKYYSEKHLYKLITEHTFWSLNTTTCQEHGYPPKEGSIQIGTSSWGNPVYAYYSIGPIGVNKGMELISSGYQNRTMIGFRTKDGTYSKVTIKPSQVETTMIPGHYEEVIDAPYLIKDTYKRIQLSPWFVNYTCGSLEAAIDKARVLVDMLGMENVKVIKIVPFDQFIKIK